MYLKLLNTLWHLRRYWSKVLFVLRHFNDERGETLAEYYVRNHGHLIPKTALKYLNMTVERYGTSVWPQQ